MAGLLQRLEDAEFEVLKLKETDDLHRWERDMVLIVLASLAEGAAAATVLDELPRLVQLAAAGRGQPPHRQEDARLHTEARVRQIRALVAAMRENPKT